MGTMTMFITTTDVLVIRPDLIIRLGAVGIWNHHNKKVAFRRCDIVNPPENNGTYQFDEAEIANDAHRNKIKIELGI